MYRIIVTAAEDDSAAFSGHAGEFFLGKRYVFAEKYDMIRKEEIGIQMKNRRGCFYGTKS